MKRPAIFLMALMIIAAAVHVPAAEIHKGKVIATMDSGGYTYIEFEENGKNSWVATKPLKVSAGDTIEFANAITMKDFTSKTLNKTFAWIFFAGYVTVEGKQPAQENKNLPAGHAPVDKKTKARVTVEPGSVKKAANGYTVAQCYSMKDGLNGKRIDVRGRVVKFAANIMGKNWVHIQDGTGEKGSNDLTVTTGQVVNIGDLVLVTGKIVYDKDFGAGYSYRVIIEDAAVVVE
jgi:hypothetical protein